MTFFAAPVDDSFDCGRSEGRGAGAGAGGGGVAGAGGGGVSAGAGGSSALTTGPTTSRRTFDIANTEPGKTGWGLEALLLEKGSIRGPEILEEPRVTVEVDPRVAFADAAVLELHVRIAALAAKDNAFVGHLQDAVVGEVAQFEGHGS